MKRSTGLLILAGVISLTLLFLFIIQGQERRLLRLNHSAFLAEIQGMLPAMPEVIAPENLAAIEFFNILNRSGKLTSQSLPGVARALKEEFGASVRFAIADTEVAATEAFGFTPEEHGLWLDFFRLYARLHTIGREPVPDNVKNMLEHYLGVSFNTFQMANYITTFSGSFGDQYGLIIIGSHMHQNMPKQVLNRFTSTKHIGNYHELLLGYYLVFIPDTVYDDLAWYQKRQHQLLLKEHSEILTDEPAKLQAILESRQQHDAATELAMQSAARPNGVFIAGNRVYSFCANQLGGREEKNRLLSLIITEFPRHFSGQSHALLKVFIIIMLLLMTFLCVNNLEGQRFMSFSISRHFSWLAASACLLPVLALLFQALSQVHVHRLQASSEIFNRLESKIAALENNYQNRLGNMMLSLQLFQERCEAEEKPLSDLVDEYTGELRLHSIREFYVCDRSGKIAPYKIKDPLPENVERSNEGSRLMQLVVQFIQHNVKFAAQDAKMSVGDGLIIESAVEIMGREGLYKIALQQGQLITFKALHGAVWLISFFQYDENKVPIKFYMYIVSRAPFQENMIDQWFADKADKADFPEYLLVNQNTSFREKVTPAWLETRPGFVRLLRHLNLAGGSFKAALTSENRSFFSVGRGLNDIDWSIAALEQNDSDSRPLSRTAIWLFATIILLIIIVIIISRYFSQIFIRPVRQLSSSVAAMANGNYDLRMDITSHDEIGQLCENFNNMAAGLKEKEYLNRFLSEIARDAIGGKVSHRATRVDGTILFSDIRDFTTMTEQKKPEEIVQMLNEFMTEAETVVKRHSGTIEKFIGDAIMVVFLPALGTAAPAVRATRAAEELLATIAEMNSRRKRQGLFTIAAGAGVATGPLLMGTIGNQQGRRDYSVTGKTVLRAAAMEKLTRKVTGKKIVLCPLTAELVLSSEIKTKRLKSADKEAGYELL
ncbi:MAG: adenylate cyclase [uncultured bacterium]|nr:MAG: adenylate cyclase [uncultured bacterium]